MISSNTCSRASRDSTSNPALVDQNNTISDVQKSKVHHWLVQFTKFIYYSYLKSKWEEGIKSSSSPSCTIVGRVRKRVWIHGSYCNVLIAPCHPSYSSKINWAPGSSINLAFTATGCTNYVDSYLLSCPGSHFQFSLIVNFPYFLTASWWRLYSDCLYYLDRQYHIYSNYWFYVYIDNYHFYTSNTLPDIWLIFDGLHCNESTYCMHWPTPDPKSIPLHASSSCTQNTP